MVPVPLTIVRYSLASAVTWELSMFLRIAGSVKTSLVSFKVEGATTLGTDLVFCEQDPQSPQFFSLQFYTHS